MPHEVIMPALGMAQDTGLIVTWHKAQGDKVATGDVLFEVETDKATMEVEATADGFLNCVRFGAGAEVPVGDVIAVIGDSPSTGDAPVPAPSPANEPIIEGHEVIMPALGMAQDTGLIVKWHKGPGDAVAAGDILFEVETDKSNMEVEAGHDGYVAVLYALEGEEAPVGQPIAVLSAERPETPVQRSRADAPNAPASAKAPATTAQPQPPPEPPEAKSAPAAKSAAVPSETGRILASPKARRLAAEQGLDLARLVTAGVPQPYNVADLETLRTLPAKTVAAQAMATDQQISARVPVWAFDDFLAWACTETTLETGAVWAAFAAASLRATDGRDAVAVRVDARSNADSVHLTDPDLVPLGSAAASGDDAPDLIVRDLSESRITSARLGVAEVPVLTVARDGDAIALTLDFGPWQLTPEAAINMIDEVAARAEEPLRHLL